jgi:hypothetical protein
MMKLIGKICCAPFILALPFLLGAQAKAVKNPSVAPQRFLDEFYQWYTPLTHKNNTTTAWDVAVKLKGKSFSAQLARLLKQDSVAKASCRELIGLDFDPFLNTQDPSQQYKVGNVTRTGETYRADIYRVAAGQQAKKPDLTAEFTKKNDGWMFLNFFYPNGTNLLAILSAPQEKCLDLRK